MGQEFTINSAAIEAKINSLLPSQGGYGAGVDFSASTMIIPTIDLTATAGLTLRTDLQTAVSHTSSNFFIAENNTQTLTLVPGYYDFNFVSSNVQNSTGNPNNTIVLNDGSTDKKIFQHIVGSNSGTGVSALYINIVIFITPGDIIKITSNKATSFCSGYYRQIATSTGELVNPT